MASWERWVSFVVLGMGFLFFSGCGIGDDAALKSKIINDGTYPLTAIYFVPSGSIAEESWQEADWGENFLPVTKLESFQFVIVETVPRQSLEGMATFDVNGNVERTRTEVRADWLNDEFITIHAAYSDNSWGMGYQWGEVNSENEVDVSP